MYGWNEKPRESIHKKGKGLLLLSLFYLHAAEIIIAIFNDSIWLANVDSQVQ
jgi:hypothetical protein